jgi:hypothetical protein
MVKPRADTPTSANLRVGMARMTPHVPTEADQEIDGEPLRPVFEERLPGSASAVPSKTG